MIQKRRICRIPQDKRRMLLLFFVVMLLAVILVTLLLTRSPEEAQEDTPQNTFVQLVETDSSDVVSITIRRGTEDPWTAINSGDIGTHDQALTILGDDNYSLTWEESISFLLGAASITAEEVLTDNPADYRDHLEDFGLDEPEYEAHIIYAHTPELHLRVGDKGPDGTWRYMLIDGDDRLFTFSNGSVEALFVNKDTLRKVSQPTLHKARIDQITLTSPEEIIQWTLNGAITDSDAADKWHITVPFSYPADAAAMSKLLSSVANLRLGAYVCPVTEENLSRYGFDTPRLIIDIHMAAGTIAVTDADGTAQATDYPESTLSFIIGGEKSDMIDYVLYRDSIYLSSHFTMGVFIDYDVTSTMSRYPVLTALGNLASLTIKKNGEAAEYILTRTEQVAENNKLVTDEDGNILYDISVTRNGQVLDYDAFAAAYSKLCLVTVSGSLPEGETSTAEPHTVFTFADVDGTVHTVALATFDVLHDAVIVDGHQAFYLIKGGLSFDLE